MKKYCKKTAERLRALEQAKSAGIHQITSLRIVFRALASSFEKYNDVIIDSLNQKAKNDIGEIIKDTKGVMERCEGTVSKLRALTKKELHSKSELDVLREELSGAIQIIQVLQNSFDSLVKDPPNEEKYLD